MEIDPDGLATLSAEEEAIFNRGSPVSITALDLEGELAKARAASAEVQERLLRQVHPEMALEEGMALSRIFWEALRRECVLNFMVQEVLAWEIDRPTQ